jgi:hypothetical protein
LQGRACRSGIPFDGTSLRRMNGFIDYYQV